MWMKIVWPSSSLTRPPLSLGQVFFFFFFFFYETEALRAPWVPFFRLLSLRDVNGYPWSDSRYSSPTHWINIIPVPSPYPPGVPVCIEVSMGIRGFPWIFEFIYFLVQIITFFNYQKTSTFKHPYIILSKFHKSYIIHRKFMILT